MDINKLKQDHYFKIQCADKGELLPPKVKILF
jgi:hypothetical protein